MSGISSKALSFGNPTNKYKFNGIEENTDFNLNIYDAFYRNLDPQIGRFWQIDPKPQHGESPFAAMNNNPILNIDPLGDTTINGQLMEPIKAEGATHLKEIVVTGKRKINAGLTTETSTSCHMANDDVLNAQVQRWYNKTKNLDKANGQVYPARPKWMDFFFGERPLTPEDVYSDDELEETAQFLQVFEGVFADASGYVVRRQVPIIGTPPAVGMRGFPIPSLPQRAANLSNQIGKNSITIRTVNGHVRYDLLGRSHGHVPTPHSLSFTRNVGSNGLINFSKPKFPTPITQQELRIIRNYLKSLNR